MRFLPPPPSQQKSHMLSQYYIWNLCWRRFAIEGEGLPYIITPPPPWGSSVIGFLPEGGGGLPHGIIPPGEVLLWDFFRGKVCHSVFLQVEGLPYGIISPWGSSPIGFLPGGGGGGLPHGIIPPGEVLLWDFFRGKVCHKVFLHWGTFAIWYNFRGDNLPWYLFPHQ